uniref:NADH dehydrogenase subunit 2 n=1 Tax=Xestocephalus gracilus TaxID=3112137 RepID=UPI002E7A94AD|nr:NADH dehydrogenase subunit 2 [Xestocephalus gracilus]WRK21297.1 NADH dehydrogenase subunit 2 [Xestocephalus gracilus]
MLINSLNMLFMNTMMIGIMVSVCSSSWLMIWTGLEISLMSFIPLIKENKILSSQSSMKYFMIQSISSALLIMSILLSMYKFDMWWIISFTLMMKMGVAPIHSWVISIVEGLNYKNMIMLFTMLKIPPLMMLSLNNSMNFLFSISSLLWGSIMGLNQFSIKKMMGYSSIFNMGFIIQSTKNQPLWMSYMLIYFTIISMFLITTKKLSINYINQASTNDINKLNKINLWILMLSMMGMPPLIGFTPKLMVMELMIEENQFVLTTMMISSSMLVSFFYMRLSYSSFMNNSTMTKWSVNLKPKSNSSLSVMSTIMTPLIISMKCMK